MPIRLKISWKPKRAIVWQSTLFLLATLACTPEAVDYGLDEYSVEIVTALENDAFLLDSGQTVSDRNQTAKRSFAAGERIYLQFSYGNEPSDPIRVHGAFKIFSDALKLIPDDQLALLENDPVRFESAWLGSHYLNLKIYIERHSTAHKLALLTGEPSMNAPEVHLYLIHNNNNDAPGHFTALYASYDLSKVLGEPLGDRRLFVHFTTVNYGNKTCTFKY